MNVRRTRARAWKLATRAAQGLPPEIEDPVALARLAALMNAGRDSDEHQNVA